MNGLGFCVDFSNVKSINNSTLALTDISKNNISTTLTNSSSNTLTVSNGYADFNPLDISGTATYYTISNNYFNTIKNEITLETCMYVYGDFGSSQYVRGVSPRTTETSSPLGFSITSDGISYEVNTSIGWIAGGVQNLNCGYNKWVYVTQTTSVTNNNFLTYVNGNLVATQSLSSSIPNGGNGLLIGRGFYGGTRNYSGRVSFVRVYEKSLTAAEVSQNFNALRGRYGI
jgi:hypothetical protein